MANQTSNQTSIEYEKYFKNKHFMHIALKNGDNIFIDKNFISANSTFYQSEIIIDLLQVNDNSKFLVSLF